MSNFILTTESTCDIWREYQNREDLGFIPLSYTVEEKTYFDTDPDISSHDFYEMMREGKKANTSLVNFDRFVEFFESYLKNGKNVLHLSFSSGLSGTCNNAFLAAEELNGKYTNKVIVVDTLCASAGQGLFFLTAVKKRDEGMSIDDLAAWAENTKLNMSHRFTVMDLKYLERTGRVSKVAAIVGTLLSVKPVLHVDDNGKLIAIQKVRGRKQSLTALVDAMAETMGDWKNELIYISHGDAIEDAEYVRDMVHEKCPNAEVKLTDVGPVIGSHSGPGTIALFFFADKR